jgi:hypothetical protein
MAQRLVAYARLCQLTLATMGQRDAPNHEACRCTLVRWLSTGGSNPSGPNGRGMCQSTTTRIIITSSTSLSLSLSLSLSRQPIQKVVGFSTIVSMLIDCVRAIGLVGNDDQTQP